MPDQLTDRTAFLLRLALTRAEDMGEAALSDEGLTGREYGLLELLAHTSPRHQIGLGRELGIDRTTCARLLAALEERGLVERVIDPSNQRAKLVSLTPLGEQRRARASAVLAACDERFQAPLSPSDRVELRRMLGRLCSLAGEGGSPPR